jgi:haloalkane dehalogenase
MLKRRFVLLTSVILISLFFATCATFEEYPLADEALPVLTTASGVRFVRTPDSYFVDLPDWPYEVKYVEINGLRQAYVDEGPGTADPILLLHGQPSWSYLYRFMIPVLVGAGHRVIAMDHIGMGRSDKPIDLGYHSFLNHTHRLERFIEELGLNNITTFVQDWGSLIGLYVVGLHPDRFSRVVVGDGTLPDFAEGEVPFTLPEDGEQASQQFFKNITRIPAQQPRFYDDDGNLRLSGVSNPDYFGYWIYFSRNDKRFRPSVISPLRDLGSNDVFPTYFGREGRLQRSLPSTDHDGGSKDLSRPGEHAGGRDAQILGRSASVYEALPHNLGCQRPGATRAT